MDTRQFEYILAIADERYVSKAAERLCISQPTLSLFVSRLEKELGVSLFRRSRNGFAPTPEGEIIVEGARRIVRIKSEMLEKIAPFAADKKNRIIVGLTPGRSVELFSAIMPDFSREMPKIEVQIIEAPIQNVEELTRHGYIDVALISIGETDDQLASECFGSEEILFAVGEAHPLAARGRRGGEGELPVLRPADLAGETFILSKRGYRFRAVVDAYLAGFGIVPTVRMESPEIPISISMIRHGHGVGFVPAMMEGKHPDLSFFRLDPPLHWEFGAVYRKNVHPSAQSRRFMDIAKGYAQTIQDR